MVAGGEAADALAGLEHFAGGLVPEHHRHHPRARAVDHREVGVAEAGGAYLDQELAGAGRIELELGDLERPRLGVRGRQPHLGEDGAADLHADACNRSSEPRIASGIGAGWRESRSTKTWTNQPVARRSPASAPNSPIS